MDFSFILQQIVVLFLLMGIGFIANRAHVMNEQTNTHLTRVVLNVTMPATILSSISGGMGTFARNDLLYLISMALVCYGVMTGLAFACGGLLGLGESGRANRGGYTAMMLFGNVGFMGFPMISAIFGQETLFYGAIINVVFNALAFSLGIRLVADRGAGFSPKMFLNAGLVASLLAILLFMLDVTLPTVLSETLGYLGDVTTPASMLLMGSSLAAIKLRELFGDWRSYASTAVKLLALPLVVYLVMGLLITDPVLLGVFVMLAAMPVAAALNMIAIRYGGNLKLISKGILISTLCSLGTIPLLVLLLFG